MAKEANLSQMKDMPYTTILRALMPPKENGQVNPAHSGALNAIRAPLRRFQPGRGSKPTGTVVGSYRASERRAIVPPRPSRLILSPERLRLTARRG